MNDEQTEMPRYKCHKIVQALAIKSVVFNPNNSVDVFFKDSRFASVNLEGGAAARCKAFDASDCGYLVVYDDDYKSWSSTAAFEEGYALLSDGKAKVSVGIIARVCHETNRAYCEALGDNSQVAWEDAPDWQRDSAVEGVRFHIENPDAGPSASHNSWMAQKEADGWVYGEVKDEEKKTHPCMVSFFLLPVEQQAKDFIFRAIVHAMT